MNRRWRSALLWSVLILILAESISGFGLFFLRAFISQPEFYARIHWLLALGFMPLYGAYQIKHYLRNRHLSKSFAYKLGLLSALIMLLVCISGVALYFVGIKHQIIDLLHVMSSFALLILLSSHLSLVVKRSFVNAEKACGIKFMANERCNNDVSLL